jgi:hypothetical protein
MLSVGIGEIQKNTSIFTDLKDVIQIVDKRKKQTLAFVYPVKRESKIDVLAGKYKNRIKKVDLSFEEIRELSTSQALSDKYDLST